MNKNIKESTRLAKHIYNWLKVYTPSINANSEHTIKAYTLALSLYVYFLETKKKITNANFCIQCFSQEYIEEWIKWLQNDRGNSPETCNNRLAALRAFLKYLCMKDVSCKYLYREATLIPRQKTAKKKITGMSKNAVKALMKAPDQSKKTGRRDLVLMIVMYATAARISELLSMKINQLHLNVDKPYITVIGKGSKIRTLYLLPKAVAHLRAYLKEFHGDNPAPIALLFYSRNLGIYSKMSEVSVNKQLKKYAAIANLQCKEVPLDTHAHVLRHAKASHWLEDGMNIVEISFLLGHAQLNTTMEYLDITTEEECKALATLEDETSSKVDKKWKGKTNSLSSMMGLMDIKN